MSTWKDDEIWEILPLRADAEILKEVAGTVISTAVLKCHVRPPAAPPVVWMFQTFFCCCERVWHKQSPAAFYTCERKSINLNGTFVFCLQGRHVCRVWPQRMPKPKTRTPSSANWVKTVNTGKQELHQTLSPTSLFWGRWWRRSSPCFTVRTQHSMISFLSDSYLKLGVTLPRAMCRWSCGKEQPGPCALWVDPEGPRLCGGPRSAWRSHTEEAVGVRHQDTDEDSGAEPPDPVHGETVSLLSVPVLWTIYCCLWITGFCLNTCTGLWKQMFHIWPLHKNEWKKDVWLFGFSL